MPNSSSCFPFVKNTIPGVQLLSRPRIKPRSIVVGLLAFVFVQTASLGQPSINIEPADEQQVQLTWPQADNFILEVTTSVSPSLTWEPLEGFEAIEGNLNQALISPSTTSQLFRLRLNEEDMIIALGSASGAISLRIATPTEPTEGTLTITVTGLPSNGTLKKADGTSVSNYQTLTVEELQNLTFTPNGNSGDANFSYSTSNGVGGTGGGYISFSIYPAPPPSGVSQIFLRDREQQGYALASYADGEATIIKDLELDPDMRIYSYSEFKDGYIFGFRDTSDYNTPAQFLYYTDSGKNEIVLDGIADKSEINSIHTSGDFAYFNLRSDNDRQIWWSDGVTGGPVADTRSGGSDDARLFVELNGKPYFLSRDDDSKFGWYRIDGKSATHVTSSIDEGYLNGTVVDGLFYGLARSSAEGYEPVVFDGTTETFIDVLPGSDSSSRGAYVSSEPDNAHEGSNNAVYFSETRTAFAYTSQDRSSVHVIEGMVKKTTLSGWAGNVVGIRGAGDSLFIASDSGELWLYDGSLTQIMDTPPINTKTQLLKLNAQFMLFTPDTVGTWPDPDGTYRIWSYNAAAGTFSSVITPFNSIGIGTGDFNDSLLLNSSVGYYFFDGTEFQFLSDPTANDNSTFTSLFNVGGELLVNQDNATYELENSTLTPWSGTSKSPVTLYNDSATLNGKMINGKYYFAANDGENGIELWIYDGTSSTMIDLNPGEGSSIPKEFTLYNGLIYFSAVAHEIYQVLWQLDPADPSGTAQPVSMSAPGSPYFSTNPTGLTLADGGIVYSSNTLENGAEPQYLTTQGGGFDSYGWNIRPGNAGSNPGYSSGEDRPIFTEFNEKVYFVANNGVHGLELFEWDASANTNPVIVDDLRAGSSSPNIKDITVWNGKLYFIASDSLNADLLYSYDGNALDFNETDITAETTNTEYVRMSDLTVASNKLYFFANDGRAGNAQGPSIYGGELYTFSDSVEILHEFVEGQNGVSDSEILGTFAGGFFFTIDYNNPELYYYKDGINEPMRLLGSTYLNTGGNLVKLSFDIEIVGSTAYITGIGESNDGINTGNELWSFDGTTLSLVNDFNKDPISFHASYVTEELLPPTSGLMLAGGNQDDLIVSSFTDDNLTGNEGSDTFSFNKNWGNDTIADFEDGSDRIDVTGAGLFFGDLTITTVDASTTLIEDSMGNSITLAGITASNISREDMIVSNTLPVAESGNVLALASDTGETALKIAKPTDIDNNPLTITVSAIPSNAVLKKAGNLTPVEVNDPLTIEELQMLSITPNGTFGSSYFSYTVDDGSGETISPSLKINTSLKSIGSEGFLTVDDRPSDMIGIYSVIGGTKTLLAEEPGRSSRNIWDGQTMVSLNGVIFLAAEANSHTELWKFENGAFSTIIGGAELNRDPSISSLTVVGDRVYFISDIGDSDEFVYWTDGNTVTQVNYGTAIDSPDEIEALELVELSDELYIAMDYANWWKIVGNDIVDTNQNTFEYSDGGAVVNNKFYLDETFTYEMHEFDGVTSQQVTNIGGPGDADVWNFHAYGSNVMLYADDAVNDDQGLYMYDGANTELIATGATHGAPLNGLYFYSLTPEAGGDDLWSWNGSVRSKYLETPFAGVAGSIQSIHTTGTELLISWSPSVGDPQLYAFDGVSSYTLITVPSGFNGLYIRQYRPAVVTANGESILNGPSDFSGSRESYHYDGTALTNLDLSGLQSIISNSKEAGSLDLLGGSGNDRLLSGIGNDRLTGFGGADKYELSGDWGNDTIIGFELGSDLIVLSGNGLSFGDLTTEQVGADTVISDGSGNSITLTNTATDDIAESDFVF